MFQSLKSVLNKAFEQLKTDKIKLWKTITLFSIVLFLLVACLFTWHLLDRRQTPQVDKKSSESTASENDNDKMVAHCDGCVRRELDGVWVEKGKENLPIIAVMIDNHPSARPPEGIDKAGLIYEAEVEGNYTRYMAVFSTDEGPKKIGPVRSARSYFLDWAAELGAVYGHCGGSPDALVKIAQKDLVDLNEFYNGQYFWRDQQRVAPHNVTTSWNNLEKFIKDKGIGNSDFTAWKFKEDEPNKDVASSTIKIDFNHPDFKVKWSYDPIDNNYIRYVSGKRQITEDGEIIKAKNILIQTLPAKVVDEKLRLEMDPIGSGPAVICLDGLCQEGEWKKDGFYSRTLFYNKDNNEVELNSGQTWVEVVRPEVVIEY